MHTHVPPDFLRRARRSRPCGFTLVELIVTVAIAALLLAVAVPSFNRLMISSRLTTQANNAVNLLAYARAEAVKRGVDVQVSLDGAISALPPGEASVPITQAVVAPTGIPASSPVTALIASPMGLLHASGATTGFSGLVGDISSSAISSDNHRCIYLYTGTTVASCTDSQTCKQSAPNATCK